MNEIKICEEERKKQLRVDLGMDLLVLIVKQLKKDTLLHLLILSISSPRKRYRIALKNLKVVKYILKTLAEYYTKFFKIKRIT